MRKHPAHQPRSRSMRHTEIHGEGTSACALAPNTSAQAATRAGVMTVGTEGEGSGAGAGAKVGATVGWVMSVVSFVKQRSGCARAGLAAQELADEDAGVDQAV